MLRISKLCTAFVLGLVFLVTTLTSGCPNETGIHKAAKTSLRLSDLTRDAIAATRKAYEGNLIGIDTKDKMALQLDKMIAGGITFNAAVKKANDEFKASGQVDLGTMRLLQSMLTSEVTTPFLAFLQLVGAITPEQAPYLWAAINALRAALLLIGNFVSQTIQRVEDNTARLENGGARSWQILPLAA